MPIPGLTPNENDVFDGFHDSLARYGVVTGCIGDPLEPTNDPMGHIQVLRREHGYLAIKTGNGTPRGAAADWDVFRSTMVDYTSFKGEGESGPEDAKSKCDMPALKNDLGPCFPDCPQIWMVA